MYHKQQKVPNVLCSALQLRKETRLRGAIAMGINENLDWEEAFEYRAGLTVELKSQPGVLHTIAYYEVMMVPPIWLENDPRPRYPHELRVVSHQPTVSNICRISECPVLVAS
ncbi:hypothetical protein [Microcoleus vaginatus]|uniref:hypothetical protein n=1 Tax=Microcoleus vaginatus TaxID=119532 RepID=UPI001F622723